MARRLSTVRAITADSLCAGTMMSNFMARLERGGGGGAADSSVASARYMLAKAAGTASSSSRMSIAVSMDGPG